MEIHPSQIPGKTPRPDNATPGVPAEQTPTGAPGLGPTTSSGTTPPGGPAPTDDPAVLPGARGPQAGSAPTDDTKSGSLRASPTGGLGRQDRRGAGEPERATDPTTPNARRTHGAGTGPAGGETGAPPTGP